MIATLLFTAALALAQPPEGGPRRGPGGPGGPRIPVILPTSTGNLDVHLQMSPQTDVSCAATGAGAPVWVDVATGACPALQARMAGSGRSPFAVDMTIRTGFALPGETAPALAAPTGTLMGTASADVEIDPAGHVTNCTPVGQDRRVCQRFTPDQAAFQPAPEGSPTRTGRVTVGMYMAGPMAEEMRRRRNGADD